MELVTEDHIAYIVEIWLTVTYIGCCHSSTEPQPVELKILKKIVSNKTLTPDEGTAAQQLLLAVRA